MTTATKLLHTEEHRPGTVTKSALVWLWLLPRNAAIAVMKAYRMLISPLYGQVCRYHPSCSSYSLQAYQHHGFTKGLGLTVWRLLRCNPFSSGGIDDVPRQTQTSFEITKHGFVTETKRKA